MLPVLFVHNIFWKLHLIVHFCSPVLVVDLLERGLYKCQQKQPFFLKVEDFFFSQDVIFVIQSIKGE